MITLTETAVKEIKHIISEQNLANEVYVRAGVRGGGCAGFKFLFTLDETYDAEKDTLFEQDGLKIVVDKKSLLYITGTTVDFQDTLESRGFKFNNPNSTGSCGCGNSMNF